MWWEGVDATRFAAEIIDHAGEGIVAYDRELRYLLWNHFMEELTGLPADQVLGLHAPEVFPQLLEQGVAALLQRAMNGETVAAPDLHYNLAGEAFSHLPQVALRFVDRLSLVALPV